MELTVGTIALAPVIVALIQLAKRLGLSTEYAPWLWVSEVEVHLEIRKKSKGA